MLERPAAIGDCSVAPLFLQGAAEPVELFQCKKLLPVTVALPGG